MASPPTIDDNTIKCHPMLVMLAHILLLKFGFVFSRIQIIPQDKPPLLYSGTQGRLILYWGIAIGGFIMNSLTDGKFALTSVHLVEDYILSEERVESPEQAIELLKGVIGDCNREIVAAIYMRPHDIFVTASIISIGSVNYCSFSNRDVITPALLTNSTDIIIVHTHPSGILSPSSEDLRAMEKLRDACNIMGISLTDSIIVGPCPGYFSFMEHNLM